MESSGATAAEAPSDFALSTTAIVIKNIHISLPREQLLSAFEKNGIPSSTALNYHVDNAGKFRGLAFANFRNAEEANRALDGINSLQLMGRQLRAEFKKIDLTQQRKERERIHSLGRDDADSEEAKLYKELMAFKKDPSKTVVCFDSQLSSDQRKMVHKLASAMNLVHFSTGEGDDRQVMVQKRPRFFPNHIQNRDQDESGADSNVNEREALSPWSQLQQPASPSPSPTPASSERARPVFQKRSVSESSNVVRQPLGPDGSKGFAPRNSIGGSGSE